MMKAKDFIAKYAMDRHIENGVFIEKHYASDAEGRAESGSILYYVSPGEYTQFHRIDCDEYWCFNAGSSVEIWSFEENGNLRKLQLGISENAEAFVFLRRGEIFASRLAPDAEDGTLITCITVPRFSYSGFELIEKEKMLERYPQSADFWDNLESNSHG